MKTVFLFLAKTKIVSRILVALWAGLCLMGIWNDDLLLYYAILSTTLLVPVLIIEFTTNPTFRWNYLKANFSSSPKSYKTTLFLTIFLGHLGVHRFYVGKIGTGIIYLLTIGCFGIGWLVDIERVISGTFTDDYGSVISAKPYTNNAKDVEIGSHLAKKKKSSIMFRRICAAILMTFGGLLSLGFGIPTIICLVSSSPENFEGFREAAICLAFWGIVLLITGINVFRKSFKLEKSIEDFNSRTNNDVITEYTDNAHSYTDTNDIIEIDEVSFDDFVDDELDEFDTANIVSEELEEEEFEEIDPTDVSYVDGMDGHEFEYFCAELLRKNDFYDVSVTRGSGDQGVDILATKGGIKYAIQCKNYASPLSNTPVQEVAAGKLFYNCHVGVVLTNSTFTPGAVSLANAAGILLWDRSELSELMKTGQTAPQKHIETKNKFTTAPYKIDPPHVTTSVNRGVVDTHTDFHKRTRELPKQETCITIDNIDIEVDAYSAMRLGVVLDNFGIIIDEEYGDQIELLFDVRSKIGRFIPSDIEIVLNLYDGNRKLLTKKERISRDNFSGRDSLCVYFEMKNLCNLATKIEMFCQKW